MRFSFLLAALVCPDDRLRRAAEGACSARIGCETAEPDRDGWAMSENYLVAHWRGELGLLKSLFANGVAGYFLLILLGLIFQTATGPTPLLFYGFLGCFLLWASWAYVGIFRCGKRYALDRTKSLSRRISGVAVATGSLIVGSLFFAVTANDMYRLGVFQ